MANSDHDDQVKLHRTPFETNQALGLQIKKRLTTPRGVPAVSPPAPPPPEPPEPEPSPDDDTP